MSDGDFSRSSLEISKSLSFSLCFTQNGKVGFPCASVASVKSHISSYFDLLFRYIEYEN